MTSNPWLKWAMPFVAIAIAGCGSTAQPTPSAPAKTSAGQAAASGGAAGYTFISSHDEIVKNAQGEGSLKVLSSADPKSQKAFEEGMRKKYPFLNVDVEEITGTDASQRFLLEFKAGAAKEWDVVHISDENLTEMLPYIDKIDLLGMAEKGVLAINPKMINPDSRNVMSPATQVGVITYNKNLVPADKVPKTWDDLLKPEWKGRKMITDIRPNTIAGVVPAKGEAWAKDWATKMKDQQPVWARGNTQSLTALAAGEYAIQSAGYLNTIERMIANGTTTLAYTVPEPVPVRFTLDTGIQQGAKHRNAALLYLEYLASPEGQKILDDVEPARASIYGDGSTRTAKAVAGKQLSVVDWDTLPKMAGYEKIIVQAFGLPSAELK